MKHPKKRVAIVGTAPGCMLAPRKGEVWVTNAHGKILPHCTMAWDMHDFGWTLDENFHNYDHLDHLYTDEERMERAVNRKKRFETIAEWSNDVGMPVMSVKAYDWIPASRAYPLEAVKGWSKVNYFTSTIAYMLAYAIMTGYKYIDIFGCDVEHAAEWAYQRDCITGWIMFGKARGKIITVNGSENRPLRAVDGIYYGYGTEQEEPEGQWYTQKIQTLDGELHDAHIFREKG